MIFGYFGALMFRSFCSHRFFPATHLLPHPPTHPRDEPDIALELQRALSYAICQTDRVAAKTEFRRRRTGFMKDVRVTFKEVSNMGG